jgi:hypothetical protein
MNTTSESRPSIPCPACEEPLPVSDDYIAWHFEGKPVPCGKCGAQLDWWATACREIESGFVHGKALVVGGMTSSPADESWQSMTDAFESYSREQYHSMIVPASAAIESSLSALLSSHLPSLVSKRRADDAPDAAGYAHKLNVLLPMVAHYNGLPQLPSPIYGALERLRGLRNELSHGAATPPPLDAHVAAELLCGALFGFHYLRYVEGRL